MWRRFVDIKFGENKNEPLHEHMRRPQSSRLVTPGAPDALQSEALAHLRDLPGPKRVSKSKRAEGENRAMLAGDAVLAYWAKDAKKKGYQPPGVAWPETRTKPRVEADRQQNKEDASAAHRET